MAGIHHGLCGLTIFRQNGHLALQTDQVGFVGFNNLLGLGPIRHDEGAVSAQILDVRCVAFYDGLCFVPLAAQADVFLCVSPSPFGRQPPVFIESGEDGFSHPGFSRRDRGQLLKKREDLGSSTKRFCCLGVLMIVVTQSRL